MHMEFLSGLALVLLTLVGYSSGAAIAGRDRQVAPRLADLGVVVVLWAAALGTRPMLGKWIAILIWLIVAGLISALLTALRRGGYESKKGIRSTLTGGGPFRQAWAKWQAFAAEMGNYQGRMLLGFFYFLVVTPFGLGVRVFSDPMAVKRRKGASSWVERRPMNQELDSAREQF